MRPRMGTCPVASSHSTTPKEYTSTAELMRVLINSSGAAQASVPIVVLFVTTSLARVRDMPMSAILAV